MDLQELRQEAIKIIKANPELKSEIQDLFSLAISEVEEGGSESHECDLAYNDMIELQNEANNNKMVKGGNVDSKSLFDLEYGDIFKIDRNPERPHTMTDQHFLFIGFSEKYAKPEGVTIEAAYFPGSFYGPNYDQYKEHSYLSGLKNGDITIISKAEAGEMLLDYYIRNDKFKNGGKLTVTQQAKFDKVMSEWKAGKLHSGSSNGPIVKDQDQAIAIAYAQANGMKKMEFGGLVYDSLSDEAKDRMDGLVPTEQINNVLSNCRYIVSQMMEEGFELDEAISFIVYKIVNDFTDKRMGYFSDEYYPEDWKSDQDKPKVLVKLYDLLSKADNLDYLSWEYDEDEGYSIEYRSGLESESDYHKGEIESYTFYVDEDNDGLIESVYDLNGHSATGLTIDQVLNAVRANNKMDQGGSVEDDQIEEYAEAIYEDLRQEYKPWELQNMSMEEAMMSVDSYDEVPENLKEEVASYLMNMASQNEFFEEDMYNKGGIIENKMQSLENELNRLESELKWTQQQNGASKQYYLRKRRSGKMTRERAMKLIDQSNTSWKKEREKVREKIKEVKDRIKRLEELSSKVTADQFAYGGGVKPVTYYVAYTSYFDTNNYDVDKITKALTAIGATNIHLENEDGKSNQPEVVVFNYTGDGTDYDPTKAVQKAFDTDWIIVRVKDWRTKKMANGGGVRKAPFKVGDMVYSYQNPNHKMRISFVEDRGVLDGVDYGWGIKVALKTDSEGKYDPKGTYSKSSNWMSQNSVSKVKKEKYADGGGVDGDQ